MHRSPPSRSHTEQRSWDPRSSFLAWVSRPRSFPWNWHHHEAWELVTILAGHGVRQIGGSAERFAPGEVVLIPPGIPHTWFSTPGGNSAAAHAVVVQFPATLLEWMRQRPELARGLQPLHSGQVHVASPSVAAAASRSLVRLAQLPTASPARLCALIDILVSLDTGGWRRLDAGAALPSVPSGRMRIVLELIARRWRQPLTQSEVAHEAGLSPSALAKQFRRLTGTTYREHLAGLRIRGVCERLATTHERIADLAEACGFRSLASFNRRFRRQVGLTPRAYARMVRSG